MIRVCLAGATGWAGSELARAIARESDLTLVAAVSRSHAGDKLSDVLDDPVTLGADLRHRRGCAQASM